MLLVFILICCITSTNGATFGKLLPEPYKLEDRLIQEGDTYDLIGPTGRIPKNHSKYLSFDHENKLMVDSAGTSVQFLVAVKSDSNNSITFEIPYTRKMRNCEGLITIHSETDIFNAQGSDFTSSLLWFYTSSFHTRLRGWIQMNGRWCTFSVPTIFREFEIGWKLVCTLRNAYKGRDIDCKIMADRYVQSEVYHSTEIANLLVKPLPGSKLKQALLRVTGRLCDAPLMIHNAHVLIRKKEEEEET